jgi:hypothetical protein
VEIFIYMTQEQIDFYWSDLSKYETNGAKVQLASYDKGTLVVMYRHKDDITNSIPSPLSNIVFGPKFRSFTTDSKEELDLAIPLIFNSFE